MSAIGKLAEWNDARGYGFIEPTGKHAGGGRVFVHVNDYRQMGGGQTSANCCITRPGASPTAAGARRT